MNNVCRFKELALTKIACNRYCKISYITLAGILDEVVQAHPGMGVCGYSVAGRKYHIFFALFFTLMGLSVNALNIDLHPWREYVIWRFLFAATVTVVLFAVSQIPLMFIRQFLKQEKLKIIKI